MTDAAWADGYLRHLTVERGASRNTVVSYRRDLAIYADWLASRGLEGPGMVWYFRGKPHVHVWVNVRAA